MTTEQICQVPSCSKVAMFPTETEEKLACLQHWEDFEKWKMARGL